MAPGMKVDSGTRIPDSRLLLSLWAGVLLPPFAFLANLSVAYALVPISCVSGGRLALHLVHLGFLVLAVTGGLVAARSWIANGAEWPRETGGRLGYRLFLAGSGLLSGATFTVVIVAQWIPTMMLNPCQ